MIDLRLGDCRQVLSTIPSESVDVIVTDPPYRLTSRGGSGTMSGYWAKDKAMRGGVFDHNDIDIEEYIAEFYRVLKDGTHCYIMCNQLNLPHFLQVITDSQFSYIKCLIWDKCNKICGRYYMNSFEYIIMLRRGKARDINNCGYSDILKVPNKKTRTAEGTNIHDSEKPVNLMRILIENSTNDGDIVLDPFMGSGSTGVGAVLSGRDFIGIEVDPSFFGIAQNRINDVQLESLITPRLF